MINNYYCRHTVGIVVPVVQFELTCALHSTHTSSVLSRDSSSRKVVYDASNKHINITLYRLPKAARPTRQRISSIKCMNSTAAVLCRNIPTLCRTQYRNPRV